jgi:Zn-dependent protease with chaperone function
MKQPQAAPTGHFQVVLTGNCLPGFNVATVCAGLQKAWRLSPAQASTLLNGAQRVVKRGLTEADADKYASQLRTMGADTIIQKDTTEASTPAAIESLIELGQKRLARPGIKPLYTLSLLVVTLLCLLIPVAYLSLAAAIGIGLLHYETSVAPAIQIHSIYLTLLVFVAPAVTGGIVVLFLLKAFLVRAPKPPAQYRLEPSVEPEFVAGVQALCKAIGVRAPREIHLSYAVNASVHFRHGWFSLLTGSKVLTIGLPLAASLTARQLVGVLAHEFGHFAQGTGMRCVYIINTVNGWLESRAYHEDEWDQRLHSVQGSDNHFLVQIIAGLALLGLWLTRLLLRLLFQISFRMSRALSRQMEFDADRYEALVAGSDIFRQTTLQLLGLDRAFREADNRNASAFREGRLLADMPGAIAEHVQSFRQQDWDQLRSELHRQQVTRYWDTHPADGARIENAERLGAAGIYRDEGPASSLFRNFPALSRQVTQRYYSMLGISYSTEQLVDNKTVLKLNQLEDRHADAIQRYFNGMFRSQPMLALHAEDSPEIMAMAWQACIDELRRLVPEASTQWQALAQLPERRQYLALIICLRGLQVPVQAEKDANGQPRDILSLRQEHDALEKWQAGNSGLMARVLALSRRRLACALEAMPTPQRAEASELVTLINALHEQGSRLAEIQDCQFTLRSLRRLPDVSTGIPAEIERLSVRHEDMVTRLLRALNPVPAPLLFQTSLGSWLQARCPQISKASDRESYVEAARMLPTVCLHAYELAMAELILRAEQSEQSAGIRPIKLINIARSTA